MVENVNVQMEEKLRASLSISELIIRDQSGGCG